MENRVFHLTPPASMWPEALTAFILLTLVGLSVFLVHTVASARRASFELEQDGLRVRAPLYGRFIPYAAIEGAEEVDLREHPGLQPQVRTNGLGLPGLAVGWFRLVDGRKSLVVWTGGERAVVVRTREGYALLASVDDAAGFAAAVAREATRSASASVTVP